MWWTRTRSAVSRRQLLVRRAGWLFVGSYQSCFRRDKAAVDFYCETLGFDLDFIMGTPPDHGSVTRFRVGIQFTKAPADFHSANFPGYYYVFVDNIDALHAEFKKKQVRFTRALESHDHGMREFEIEDCNGFRLRFGQYL